MDKPVVIFPLEQYENMKRELESKEWIHIEHVINMTLKLRDDLINDGRFNGEDIATLNYYLDIFLKNIRGDSRDIPRT